jgi:aminoglycoside phosphotransferase (APT) family kinase protein
MAHDNDSVVQHPHETLSRGRRDSILHIVSSPSRMRDVLERHLWLPDGGAGQIADCRVGKIRTGSGFRFLVEYHLRLRSPRPGTAAHLMVTGLSYSGAQTRDLWETLRFSAPQSNAAGAMAAGPIASFSYVPDLDMLLQVFPHDARLPGLATLMAGRPPEFLPSIMAEFGDGAWQLEHWTAESLKYRPTRRATLRLDVRARNTESGRMEERFFFAKVYPDPGEALRAYQRQDDLYQRIVAAGASFGVAKPVAHAADLQTVIQSAVPGVSLDRLVSSGPDACHALRVAARAVAGLHQTPLDGHSFDGYTSPRLLPNRIDRLKRDEALLASAHPELAGTIATLVTTIVARLSGVPPAPIHGDLKPEHVYVDGSNVFIIDFDFLRASDPMLDVVRMETYLAKSQVPASAPSGHEAAARVFIDEYFACSPRDVQERLPLYHAMSMITAASRVKSGGNSDQPLLVEEVIRQATLLLQEPGGTR